MTIGVFLATATDQQHYKSVFPSDVKLQRVHDIVFHQLYQEE